jgi:hypothetical protein
MRDSGEFGMRLEMHHPIPQLKFALDAIKGSLTGLLRSGSVHFAPTLNTTIRRFGTFALRECVKHCDEKSLLRVV